MGHYACITTCPFKKVQILARFRGDWPKPSSTARGLHPVRTGPAATVRLYRNDEFLGEQRVALAAGKNLFSFPQALNEPGPYRYDVRVDAPGDPLPQNNRASGFATVRGEPRILIVSAAPDQDRELAAAIQSTRLTVQLVGLDKFPSTLAEMQSYDAIFISNLAAGDLGLDRQKLLESAVRDFGVGLVCVGGDQTYAAGGYRGTPLETTLPVSMDLDSKKVLPSGAVVLIMHGMEFNNGNQVARDCAQGVLAALGPADEMGVLLWDGDEHWLFPLQKVGKKAAELAWRYWRAAGKPRRSCVFNKSSAWPTVR